MDLIQLGAQLRQAREARKLSLKEVTEATKISRRILVAFEDGDRKNFPHPVYTKGFIRNYARLLGLDPQECVRVVERECPTADACNEKVEHGGVSLRELTETGGVARASVPWGAIVIVCLLVGMLALLIWYMGQSGRNQKAQTPAATEVQVEEQAAAQAPLSPSPELVEQQSVEASIGGVSEGLEAEAVPAEEEHVLIVSVMKDQSCWIGVAKPGAEGEVWAEEFNVHAGQDLAYRFKGSVRLRFGKLEAVTLTLDGKDRPVSGGGVVDVTLP
ncbi:MAG: helix-turn-helix domain-containing protein [Desulfovibrionaceae bacterium]